MLLLKAITMFISRSVYRYLLKVLRLPNPNLVALSLSILKTTCVMLNNKLDTNLCKMEFKVLVCTRIFIMGKTGVIIHLSFVQLVIIFMVLSSPQCGYLHHVFVLFYFIMCFLVLISVSYRL